MPSLPLITFQDQLEWFLRMNSEQPYCTSTGCRTDPPGRTCVKVQHQQDSHSLLCAELKQNLCWQGRLMKHSQDSLRTNFKQGCVDTECWETVSFGRPMEQAIAIWSQMSQSWWKKKQEPETIIACIRLDSPEASGWMNTTSVGTIEKAAGTKVVWTEPVIKHNITIDFAIRRPVVINKAIS